LTGFLPASAAVIFPDNEVVPTPPVGYRVMFLAFLLRGLSLPVHEFLHGLLFVYGMRLHQLTPNSLLHIACFITLCEASLGIDPHWVLWKFLFRLRPSGSLTEILELGGAIVSISGVQDGPVSAGLEAKMVLYQGPEIFRL
jgi:hypothetical protein